MSPLFSAVSRPACLNDSLPTGNFGLSGSESSPDALSREQLLEALRCAHSELTQRREAEVQLREAGRRKDEFLAMLAHELRNPLAPISAAAELLKVARSDERRIRQVSEIITRQVGHMTGLIDDLMDISRVSRGIITLERESVELHALIGNAVEQTQTIIASRQHQLQVQLGDEPINVLGDRTRLVQVITNLINNAAKYTPPGGRIELAVDSGADFVELHIRDNGIGIDPALLPYVFDLFTQAERSHDRSHGGLGLGLALARSLVELHGGQISVRSDGAHKGSEFTVRLPRLAAAAQVAPVVDAPALAQPHNKLRVLIVDDNIDAAQMLGMFLEAAGHEVRVTDSSRDALQRAQREVPDVCLIDIGMPEMDGNTLAGHLRVLPQTSDAVLIAVTGYGQASDREMALESGFDFHFVKPMDPARLSDLLANLQRRPDAHGALQ